MRGDNQRSWECPSSYDERCADLLQVALTPRMQPQQGGSWRSPDDGSSNQKRTTTKKQVGVVATQSGYAATLTKAPHKLQIPHGIAAFQVRRTTSGGILPQSSGSPTSRGTTVSSRARNQLASSNLAGLYRTNIDLSSRPVPPAAASNSSVGASASGGASRRWTADTDASSTQAKSRARLAAIPQGRHTTDVLSKYGLHAGSGTVHAGCGLTYCCMVRLHMAYCS